MTERQRCMDLQPDAKALLSRVEALHGFLTAVEGVVPEERIAPARALVVRAQERMRLSRGYTVVALAGATGSGKSSLFNAVARIELSPVGLRRPTTGGMDVMGQRMIFFVGQFVCLVLALVPAVLAGGLTILLTQWLVGPPAAVLLATLPVLAVLGVELWLGVHWVGRRFEALDISAELRS